MDLLQQQHTSLRIVSYNMHGFNQGAPTITDLLAEDNVDIVMLQEHWLTPANLSKFSSLSPNYFMYGSSAMSNSVEKSILVGRPFGGVMFLIKNMLRVCTEFIYSSDRYAIIRVANFILINVYFPCKGTDSRQLICQDILDDIWSHRERFMHCNCLLGGDLNADLSGNEGTANIINSFLLSHDFTNCDKSLYKSPTYVNDALNHESVIDYFFSDDLSVSNYDVLDPAINFSDHLPIAVTCPVDSSCIKSAKKQSKCDENVVTQLRWDHGDMLSYYLYTGEILQPVLVEVDKLDNYFSTTSSKNYEFDIQLQIDIIYSKIVSILATGAELYIPVRKKSFYKYWWDESLNLLKLELQKSTEMWKACGKPRSGQIFQKHQTDKNAYRKCYREHQQKESISYSNALHDSLINKNGKVFWKTWQSKFETKTKYEQVDGCVDKFEIAEKFAKHFSNASSSVSTERANNLKIEYSEKRSDYYGLPLLAENLFDIELVDRIISELQRGKAAGLDTITAEHLQFAHPIVRCILYKLFNIMVTSGCIPVSFGCSYTIPLIKSDTHGKALTCNDFRGISISSVISKVFEHCILHRFKHLFKTSDNQFGFKTGLGCSQAINVVRCVVDRLVKGGSTVNICSLDLSKAFDKMNHHALFIKLMKRQFPLELIIILEKWFSSCFTCVNWYGVKSLFFSVNIGVRQGGVLSPLLFAIYLDDAVQNVCSYGSAMSIILYADDIMLLSPSIITLQKLLSICERELIYLDMTINVKKILLSANRFQMQCVLCKLNNYGWATITMGGRNSLPWGIYN